MEICKICGAGNTELFTTWNGKSNYYCPECLEIRKQIDDLEREREPKIERYNLSFDEDDATYVKLTKKEQQEYEKYFQEVNEKINLLCDALVQRRDDKF